MIQMIEQSHWSALRTPIIAAAVAVLAGCGSSGSQPDQGKGGIQSELQPSANVVVYDLVPWSTRPFIGPGEGSVLQYLNPHTDTPPTLRALAGTMELVAVDVPNFSFTYQVRNVHFRAGDSVWTLEGPGDVGFFQASSFNLETPLQAQLTLTSNRGGGSETVELVGGGGPESFTLSSGLPSFDAVSFGSKNGYSISLSAIPRLPNSGEEAR